MSDIRVFKRYEKKYLLSENQYLELLEMIEDTLEPDEYEKSLVQNIYFDTEQCRLIRTSLERPVYKEKLRLRYYNEFAEGEKGYLEIKKKYKGIVYKRRESMYIHDALNFVEKPPEKPDTQIGKELAWFSTHYGRLTPKMYVNYKRKAYVYSRDKEVRVTFDRDVTYRSSNICFEDTTGEKLLEKGQVLMEVKTPAALPLAWVRAFERLNIYPTSFSKYGRAYLLEQNIID